MCCGFEIISVMYICGKKWLPHLFSAASSSTAKAPSPSPLSPSCSALDVKNGFGFFCFLRDMSDGCCGFPEDALPVSGGDGDSAGGGGGAAGGGGGGGVEFAAAAADCSFTAWMVDSIDRTEKSRNISRV